MPALMIVPGGSGFPAATSGGVGLCNDVNGNGRQDFADVVLFFNQMNWVAANEPVAAFDYNGNGRDRLRRRPLALHHPRYLITEDVYGHGRCDGAWQDCAVRDDCGSSGRECHLHPDERERAARTARHSERIPGRQSRARGPGRHAHAVSRWTVWSAWRRSAGPTPEERPIRPHRLRRILLLHDDGLTVTGTGGRGGGATARTPPGSSTLSDFSGPSPLRLPASSA